MRISCLCIKIFINRVILKSVYFDQMAIMYIDALILICAYIFESFRGLDHHSHDVHLNNISTLNAHSSFFNGDGKDYHAFQELCVLMHVHARVRART